MFSLPSPSFFVHQPVYRRRREPAFGLIDPWTSCLGDGRFIFGNAGFRPEPTYFLIDPFDVNDLKTSSKRQKASPKTSANCRRQKRENFHVELDLADFKPEEIGVSLDCDRLKIHAKSEDKHGITSEVFKWYSLPENIDIDKLTSSLSQEGALHINAPFKTVPKQDKHPITNGGAGSSQNEEQIDEANQQEVEIEKEDSTQPTSTGVITEKAEDAKDTSTTIGLSENDSGFHVELPMERFKPEHVNVSIDDHKLMICAKKVDEGEGHFRHEEVTKWFNLPSDVDVGQLRSNIRDDGILVINAPKANDALTLEKESAVKGEDETAQKMSIDDNANDHAQEK